jgi:hypothetical protein
MKGDRQPMTTTSTGKTPAKKAPAKKAAAPKRSTRQPAAERTAVQPQAVEDAAVAAAQPRQRRRSADRPAAKAAAALRAQGAEPVTDPDAIAAELNAEYPTDPDAAAAAAERQLADEQAAAEADLPTAQLPFHGRSIAVRSPTAEQLVMYRRLSGQFKQLAERPDDVSVDEALRQMDRAIRLIQSVMTGQDDRDWLEGELLDGNLRLSDCNALLRAAFAKLQESAEQQQNRATRRAGQRGAARFAD